MVHVAKRAWLGKNLSRNPLNELGILLQVLSYAGPGQRLFYAGVSSLWLDAYRAVNSEDATSTSTSAVFASASRLRWAHGSGLPSSPLTSAQSSMVGGTADGDTLAALHELCVVVSTQALAHGAAEAGSLHALIWLHSKHSPSCPLLLRTQAGCVFSYRLAVTAAGAGHVHVLDFLHQHGCPLDASALHAAARGNHVPALRWLHMHTGALCTEPVSLTAARHGSIEAMAYLLPHLQASTGALTLAEPLTNMLNLAGCHGQLEAAKWLRE
jgi:Ankyrin repeats (many copies)